MYSPERADFENANSSGDFARMVNFGLDYVITQLTEAAGKVDNPAEFAKTVNEFTAKAGEQIAILEVEKRSNLVDIYRLKSRQQTIPQIIAAPHIYAHNSSFDARRKASDGLMGVYVDLLDESISNYLSLSYVDTDDEAELKGVINELTTLALINRGQVPCCMAITSCTRYDLRQGIDLEVFRIPKQLGFRQFIQVKSNPSTIHKKFKSGVETVVVNAVDIGNYKNGFQTARLIISENSGNYTDDDKQKLDAASARLLNKITSNPAKYDLHQLEQIE